MGQVSANVKDALSLANIPIDGVSVPSAGPAVTAGQALRNVFAVGKSDGSATYDQLNVHTTSSRIIVNPTVSTSAYVTGYNVGGLLSFANAFGAANTGVLQSVSVSVAMANAASQTAGFTFSLLSGKPAASPTDHAAYAISVADAQFVMGSYTLNAGSAALGTNNLVFNLDGIGAQAIGSAVNSGTATTLYGILSTLGTPTYTSNALWISVGVLQD